MRRAVLIAALAFSGAVHAALVPEHLREMPLLGVAFIPAAAASLALALALALRPTSTLLRRLAAMLLASELVVYICVVAAGVEPVETIAVLCKLVELVALGTALYRSDPRRPRAAVLIAIAGGVAGLSATAALAAPAAMPMSAQLPEQQVVIPSRSYDPPLLISVTGQTITWRNLDSTTHTVTADDGSFDSGQIPPGAEYSWTPAHAGKYAYHCSIHHFMHGEIDVYDLALTGPAHAIAAGSSFTLRGIAQTAGSVVELTDATGAVAATTSAAEDGSFSFALTATAPGEYRASTSTETSPTYTVAISARPLLTLLSHRGRRYRLQVTTTPAQPGAVVALEQYIPELFAFHPIQRLRLDTDSRAVFSLRARPGLHVRLRIAAAVHGFHGGVSRELRLP